jgi:hypothetical protein
MTAQERKERPVYSGVLRYFPLALLEVARCSYLGNEQHNAGQPLHWDRAKSTDEADALVRHLLDAGTVDSDGIRHTAKVAWRALALLQKELEAASEIHESGTRPVHDVVNAPEAVNTRLSYDERRSHIQPCKCGALFTHPEKCDAHEQCMAAKHPHFRRPLTLAEQRSRTP